MQRNRYSVPCELAGQRVSTRLYPTRISVVAGDAVVASHQRLSDRGHTSYDWQHYIDLIQRKPGALRNGAPFADMPEPLKKLKLGLMRHDGGDKVMAQVLAAVPSAGLEAVLVAVELVVESGALSTEHVLNVLARLNAKPIPEAVQTTLQLQEAPVANTGRYDSLRTLMPVARTIRSIFNAPDANEATRLLGLAIESWRSAHPKLAAWAETNLAEGFAVFALPPEHRVRMRTTNGLERLNKEIKRRTRVATLFPNTASCLRLVTAILAEQDEEWMTAKIYLTMKP